MKPMISRKNVSIFLCQKYGMADRELFSDTMNAEMKRSILESVFLEFTDCEYHNGTFSTLDPFNKETLSVPVDSKAITSMDTLMEGLVTAHKSRMQVLAQAREKVAKKNRQPQPAERHTTQKEQEEDLEL